MPKITVTKEEWAVAHERLDSKSDGTKLPYSAVVHEDNTLKARPNYRYLFSFYKTTHSFIKINGSIYAIAQGKSKNAIAGRGTYSVVKFMVDEESNLSVVKIQKKVNSCPNRKNEISITESLNLSKGTSARPDTAKFYTHMVYKGEHNLLTIIPTLNTEAERFEVAIALCLAVDRLHRGVDDKNNTSYAHLDIKPANFTKDEAGQIHLIDYGFAEKGLHETPLQLDKGTRAYLPCWIHFHKQSRHHFDMLALKRSLFMPERIYCQASTQPLCTKDVADLVSVLTPEMLCDYGLDPFINTVYNKDYFNESETMNASTLAAILINCALKLGFNPEMLKNNASLSFFIASVYADGKRTSSAILEVLPSQEHHECIKQFENGVDDSKKLELENVKQQASTLLEACARRQGLAKSFSFFKTNSYKLLDDAEVTPGFIQER